MDSSKASTYSTRKAAVYLGKGMAIAVLLIGLKLMLEKTPLGHFAEQQTRAFLLDLLPAYREQGPDAIVVDISHFAGGDPDPATGRLKVTSREKLRELITRLSALGALAIGVDIDFSTQGNDWLDPGDPAFFQYCLEINRTTPVRLGVWRSIPDPTGMWLDLPSYSTLAAALFVTDSTSGQVPIWVSPAGSPKRLLTLGAALAVASGRLTLDPYSLAKDGGWRHFIFDETVDRELPLRPSSVTIRTQEAPVNYSVMKQLTREYIPQAGATDLVKFASRIQGRIVILGAVEKTDDLHAIPGDAVNRPGVFLHAAQAHTLTSEPVYEFAHNFRLVLDLVISFALLLAVVLWRRSAYRLSPTTPVSEGRVVAIGCGLVVLAGVLLLVYFRVFWLDFFLVAIFLILHKPAEHALLAEHPQPMNEA